MGAHSGISDSFFCTKYTKTRTYENVIVFRGTGPRVADLEVDASHLFNRHSAYINGARSFLSTFGTRDTIVAGHSLGGFIAVSMAFNRPVKVVAINPPWMLGVLNAAADQIAALTSRAFQSSKSIIYQSNSDLLTTATHPFRIRSNNINFIRLGAVGWHNLDPIIAEFRQHRRYAIAW